jgi:hypothetical protein
MPDVLFFMRHRRLRARLLEEFEEQNRLLADHDDWLAVLDAESFAGALGGEALLRR